MASKNTLPAKETAYTLIHPIEAHGEPVTELNLRAPTGKDIRSIGIPFTMASNNGNTEYKFDAAACASYMSVLGSIPPSSVDLISASDYQNLMFVIVSFFGATAR